MTNQNRRPGEVEIRLETPPEGINPLGNFQFLIIRDLEDLDYSRKRGIKSSAKGKCQTVRAYIPNEFPDGPAVGTCKTTSGYSMPEIKSKETNDFPTANPSKTKGDYSEDCENSSQVSVSTGVGDSSEVDSRMTSKGSRQTCCRRSSRTTIHSSQNGQTDEIDQRCPLNGREQMGDGAQQNPKEEVAFPVECFTQLYKRIEALEDLLQRGLESFKKDPCSCKEKSKGRKTQQSNKVKFVAPEKSKPPIGCEFITLPEFIQEVMDSNISNIPVASTIGEKESMNKDNELQNIKKRVVALEEKLKRLKLSATKSNINERSPSKNTLTLLKLEKKNECQVMTEKHNNSAAQTHSDVDSFQKSEILVLNTDLNESADWKRKKKVVKKTFKKYKKAKAECSSAISSKKSSQTKSGSVTVWNCPSEQSAQRTHSLESTLFRYPASNDSDKTKKTPAAVVYLKCRNASVAWPSSRYLDRRRQKMKDLCRKIPVTNLVMSQFTEKDNGNNDPYAFGDCKFRSSPRKSCHTKRRSRRYLVPKHSPTGMHSFHRRHTAWTVTKKSSPHHPFVEEYSQRRHRSRHHEREIRKEKWQRRTRHLGTRENANGEDKMKIPVLFKEVCKPMKPVHKISNFSMRFVLVENDPNNPLRNLIQKLSTGKPLKKKEQYVFGVSKCSCDEQSKHLPKNTLRLGGPSKLLEEGLIRSILGSGQKSSGGGGGLLRFRPDELYI